MRDFQVLRLIGMRQVMSIRSNLIAVSLFIPLVLASCRVTSQSVTKTQETHDFQRLEIIYRAHPATGPVFSPVSSGIVQAAAKVDSDPFQSMSWSKAELRIECPHPNGRADMAKVTLHFRPVACGEECERKSWDERREDRAEIRQSRRATFRERCLYGDPVQAGSEVVTELDLPKSDLDAILQDLNSHGFFDERGHSTDPESQLEVRLNRRWTSRTWGYEPSLDALTTRVYHEGTRRTATAEHEAAAERTSRFGWLNPFARSR